MGHILFACNRAHEVAICAKLLRAGIDVSGHCTTTCGERDIYIYVYMGISENEGYNFGAPIIRIIVFWGPYWGPTIYGNYHICLSKPDSRINDQRHKMD